LRSLHAGINPAKILLEGSEMDDADSVTDWATATGSSPIRVKVTLDTPMQKFWLWQPSGLRDIGSEDLDGQSREEIWESIQIRSPDVRSFGEYLMYRRQEEIQWRDLPVIDLTLVPTNIPVSDRGTEFAIVNHTTVKPPREVGPLTPMKFQIFTIEKMEFSEPVDILAPNEISLAQLVTYFILPSGIQSDVGSVFYWNLREIPDVSKADKTKKTLEQIPNENSTRRIARCKYGSVPMCFAMPEDATIGRLKERFVDWMKQRGQGEDWTIEGEDGEIIDFNYEYPVIEMVREQTFKIYLKQREIGVKSSESWINLSDELVKWYHLPLGTLFRIFPVIGAVGNQDAEDHSYDITWEEGKQYWFDIVNDDARDRTGNAKQIRMIDGHGRVDSFVVRNNATDLQIINLWKAVMEIPDGIQLSLRTRDNHDYYWGYHSQPETFPCTFLASNFHANANIFGGSEQFKAEQISRILSIKIPPFAQCHVSRINGGSVNIQYGGEVVDMHHPAAGATRRCPVQSSTPLGPDQVNVLLLLCGATVNRAEADQEDSWFKVYRGWTET
jgi:hypothetical protein